jgi:hypothetical protein
MPAASKWMIGFGVLALLCALLSAFVALQSVPGGLAVGVTMLAAGAAAAQGRTSLRKTGRFVGLLVPAMAAGFYGWRAVEDWRRLNAGLPGLLSPILLSLIALGGVVTFLMLMKFRSADNIAERGYSVLPLTSDVIPQHKAEPVKRRSSG